MAPAHSSKSGMYVRSWIVRSQDNRDVLMTDSTRDEKAVGVMKLRINAFGLLLGGVPSLDDDAGDGEQRFVDEVLRDARNGLVSTVRRQRLQDMLLGAAVRRGLFHRSHPRPFQR